MLDCALQQNAYTAHIWFTIPIWYSGTTLSQIWKFLEGNLVLTELIPSLWRKANAQNISFFTLCGA